MTADEQLAYLTKGCVDIVRAGELKTKLERAERTGKPLVVKVGFDPTAPDLHLGHTVLIRKMKHFQDLGHRVIFLIGDFTGLIGDPTGRSKTRPALTAAEIEQNAETYKAQVFKILDRGKTVVDFNSRWLAPLGVEGMIRLAARYNVAQMLERRDFKQRYESGKPIAVHEFLYPLAQAYDSVFLEADVELGGTDQLFNLNVGRDIMPSYGLEAQVVMTTPLLEGLDGVDKMSKSLGNYIGVTEPAGDMFGKVMSISDALMWRYYLLLTDLNPSQIAEREAAVADGRLHPMEAKKQLAAIIVGELHGEAAAGAARDVWVRSHSVSAGEQLELALGPALTIQAPPEGITVERVLVEAGLAESGSDAGRKIKQGGVSMADGSIKFANELQRFTTERHRLRAPSVVTIRVGRKALVVTLSLG